MLETRRLAVAIGRERSCRLAIMQLLARWALEILLGELRGACLTHGRIAMLRHGERTIYGDEALTYSHRHALLWSWYKKMGRQGLLILLAEDEALVRSTVTMALRELGVDVVEKDSGDAAWKSIEDGQIFDLLITDVRMPGTIDGFELARRVKSHKRDANIIIMSGHTGGRHPTEFGFEHFLPKPFTVHKLSSLISKVMPKAANFHRNPPQDLARSASPASDTPSWRAAMPGRG